MYLQGNGNGTVSGIISDNASNSNGKINLTKQDAGTWTLTGANTYTGTTNITGGTLRLDQVSSTTVMATATANYTFDNVTGTTVANSGTGGIGMNGTLTGGATVVPGGRFGNALSLTGTGYLNVGNFVAVMGNTSNWTIAAWVKTATPGSTILSKSTSGGWSSGTSVFYLGGGVGPGAGGIPSAVRDGGGFYQGSTAATSVTDNNWHLVTYVNTAGNYAIYVDGVAQSLADGYNGFTTSDLGNNVRIGATTDTTASDGTVNFNGLLDNVQVYRSALTAPQVASLYQGTNAGVLPTSTTVTISAGATLDLNNTTQQVAGLSGVAGSSITLGTGQLTVNSALNSLFAGSISGAGGSFVKQGPSTLTLSGTNSYGGGTTVSAGGLLVAGPQAIGTGPLTIHASGTAQLQPSLPTAVVLPSVTLDGTTNTWSGSLDVTNNKLVVEPTALTKSTALANLQNQAATQNIMSSTLTSGFGLAVVDNAALTTPFTTFGGVAVDANSILIATELLGDTDLSGTVDLNDLNTVLNNLGTANSAWTAGNFDNAATVDLNDLNDVLNNLGVSFAGNASVLAAEALIAATPTPEPTTLALLAFAAPLFLRRPKRI